MSKQKKSPAGNPGSTRADKKAAVLEKSRTGKRWAIVFMFTAVAAVVVIGGLLFSPMGRKNPTADATKAETGGPAVTLPVAEFEDGKARYYQYDAGNGLVIKFFVLKSSDGIIRAAFDACDVCWPANRGYQQEGDEMVCRNCGQRFASVLVNEVKGGCNPAPLRRKVEGDKLVIQVADIVEGRSYFDFSKARKGS